MYRHTLPDILYVEDVDFSYRKAYWHLNSWDNNTKLILLIRPRKKCSGKKYYVCLDTANGDLRNENGKIYLWIFDSLKKANQKYNTHQAFDRYVDLKSPVCCMIADHFTK